MRRLFSDIKAYLKAILLEGKNWLLTIFEVLGIVSFFLPEMKANLEANEPLARGLGAGCFLVSFLCANVTAYGRLLRKTETQPARIVISKRSVTWRPGASISGTPLDPMHCAILLDVKNHGDEQGKLNFIRVDRIHTEVPFVESEPSRIRYSMEGDPPDRARIPIEFPHTVDSGAWNVTLLAIETRFDKMSHEQWAELLKELRTFSVDLSYEYETFDGERHQQSLPIRGTFDAFRKKVIQDWMAHNRHDLASAAVDLQSLLDDRG